MAVALTLVRDLERDLALALTRDLAIERASDRDLASISTAADALKPSETASELADTGTQPAPLAERPSISGGAAAAPWGAFPVSRGTGR